MKRRRPVEDRTLVKFQWAPKTKTPQAINIKEAGNSTHSVREFLSVLGMTVSQVSCIFTQ